MDLVVLIIVSVLLSLISYGYLLYDAADGNKDKDKLLSLIKKNIKTLLYNLLFMAVMIALSVVLVKVYTINTLIDNLKVITLLAVLVTVAMTDIRRQIIPNKVILVALVIRVGYAVAEFITLGQGYFTILKSDLWSLMFPLVMFFMGALVMKNSIGMGDIKLVLIMGLYQGITGVISSLFFSLLATFFVAVAMLITRKKSKKDSIAFAPSVLFGTAVSMFMTGI